MNKLAKRKMKLWLRNPCCHWCKQETILAVLLSRVNQDEFPNLATIDHLTTRIQGRTGGLRYENTVLSCYKCNQERNEKEQSGLPKEFLRERSKEGHLRKMKKRASIFLKPEYPQYNKTIDKEEDNLDKASKIADMVANNIEDRLYSDPYKLEDQYRSSDWRAIIEENI